MRLRSSDGWKVKSKPASVLMVESLAILSAVFTRRFSRKREFLGEQGIDHLERADFAPLELADGLVEDLERPRHLEADQGSADAVEHRGYDLGSARSWLALPGTASRRATAS